ncbi:MAG TPA: AAA family ATPase [Polyangiales bacterium]|nr:AAA family ATPase [Polyangiales bacterium]
MHTTPATRRASLIVLAGLPGVGKTTVARLLARQAPAVHLRIDSIEQTLRRSPRLLGEVQEEGYFVAAALAGDNLRLGLSVIADAVNGVQEARALWREQALLTGAHLLEVELVCTDVEAHRARVDGRSADIAGLHLPSWHDVQARDFEAWAPALRLDTSRYSAHACALAIAERLVES